MDRASRYVVGWVHSGFLLADAHSPSDLGECFLWSVSLCLSDVSCIDSPHCSLLGVFTSLVGGPIFVS